jgi:hypothetical protein
MNFVRATNDRLTSTYTLPATSGYTLSIVGQAGASGGGTARAVWVDGATDSVLGEAGGVWVYANSAGAIVSGVAAVNRLAQVTAVQSPTSPPGARLYVDEVLAGSSAGPAVAGTLLVSSTGADAWNGQIREIVVASSTSTPSQLRALAAYYRRQHPGLT